MDLKLNIIVYNVGGLLRGIQTVTKKNLAVLQMYDIISLRGWQEKALTDLSNFGNKQSIETKAKGTVNKPFS